MGCCCAKSTAVATAQSKDGAPAPTVVGKSGGGGSAPSAEIIAKKVAQAKTTRVLALRECGLKVLPAGAVGDGVAELRTVDLSCNKLKALPEGIGSWSGLQNLLCGQNVLTELPVSIGKLVGLQKLVLSENQLRALPAEVSHLGKLKILQLDGNKLGPSLTSGNAFAGPLLSVLEELDLSGNALKELPSSLGSLGELTRLILTRNELTQLPVFLGGLKKLQYMDAAENRLASVPAALLEGTSLSELWLKGNPLDRLQLRDMPGFTAFLERRKKRIDARIDSNVVGAVDLSVCGLE